MANKKSRIEKLISNEIITPSNICYDILRTNLKCSYAESKHIEVVRRDTDCGRAILKREDQLEDYWYTYAKMIKKQWDSFWQKIPPLNFEKDFELVDHGCGQGLASCLFLDKYGRKYAKKLSKITLIEPSSIAIETAGKILDLYSKKFGHQIPIHKVASKIDQTNPREVVSKNNRPKLHLLSNILDVESFDPVKYFKSLLSIKESQRYLCVSHSRESQGGNSRFRKVEELFNNLVSAGNITSEGPAVLETFNFDDNPKNKAIYLTLSTNNDK